MATNSILFILLLSALWPFIAAYGEQSPPPLMLAKSYIKGLDVSKYFVSEKLDGVRAFWDGNHLYSRSGRRIPAPVWFLSALPDNQLDGELWLGRGRFDDISALVRRQKSEDRDWHDVKYMVYDLPDMIAPYAERLWVLKTVVAGQRKPWLKAVSQQKVASEADLQVMLRQVVAGGGEGLMLRHSRGYYQASRSDDLLKLKVKQDDEAIVIDHIPGEGKYRGLVGALLVRDKTGREFRLGSGLSDAERRLPPQIGAQITYSYNGLTSKGLPRFARYVRIRPQE